MLSDSWTYSCSVLLPWWSRSVYFLWPLVCKPRAAISNTHRFKQTSWKPGWWVMHWFSGFTCAIFSLHFSISVQHQHSCGFVMCSSEQFEHLHLQYKMLILNKFIWTRRVSHRRGIQWHRLIWKNLTTSWYHVLQKTLRLILVHPLLHEPLVLRILPLILLSLSARPHHHIAPRHLQLITHLGPSTNPQKQIHHVKILSQN